jgi:peptidoglycan hydrolase-like protein with peptidoglycan-binding domain
MNEFIFDDFARTTLGAATNAGDGTPLTPSQIDQVIAYLKSPNSGPDGITGYAEYLNIQMQAHPPHFPPGIDYVGFSGTDHMQVKNFDNAMNYVSDVGKKAGIIGDTPWGTFIERLDANPEFDVIQRNFRQFMESQGFKPLRADHMGALQDIMWNAGSPEYFENAIATQRPIVAFVENAPPGRGFSNFELPTALKHPDAVINGYPVSAFGPDPLTFASRSAAEFQQLERTIAQAATANGGHVVNVGQVRSSLNLIEGYDAVNKTLFNQPVDAFKSLSFDEMAVTRSAWVASPARVAAGLHASTMADTTRSTLAEPGAPRGPPSQAMHAEGVVAAESVIPPRQRGFASMELLIGEVPRNTLIRSGGMLATGIDLGLSAQRAAELLEQDNPRAARSEVDHALARNLGAWTGGTSMAYAVGTSGYLPAALLVADAVLVSKGFDKAMELKENREIYHQTDKQGVAWQFDGYGWTKEGVVDGTLDGEENPVASRIGASYGKSLELGAYANATAVKLALGKVPPPQDPFDIPARASDQWGLDNPSWKRNPDTEQWQRVVKTGVTGANDRGTYDVQTADSERAAELNREALGRIAENIARGRETIAATYLEHHAARREGDFVGVPAAVQTALPRADLVTGSDQRTYHREADGTWTSLGQVAQGNLALELELTRMVRQPSIEQHAQRLTSLEAQPEPTREQMQQNELLHRYYQHGINHLTPEWQQAIEQAMQRTRDEHGLASVGSYGLLAMPLEQRTGNSPYSAASPIAHYERGPDGVDRIAAVTSTEEIVQSWREVRMHHSQQASIPEVPESPELRVAASSPQQSEAREQAVREAQRSGLSQNEVEQVATLAAVQVHAPRLDPTQRERTEEEIRPERENVAVPEAHAPAQPAAATMQEAVASPEPEAETRAQTQDAGPIGATTPATPEVEGLRPGDHGEDVELLQFRLQRVGMQGPGGQPVPQDGRFGPETEHAVRQFQQAQALPVTGVVDQEMQMALMHAHHAHLPPTPAAAAQPLPQQAAQQDACGLETQVQAAHVQPRPDTAGATPATREQPAADAQTQRAAPMMAPPSSGSGAGDVRREQEQEADELAARPRGRLQAFPPHHPDYPLFAAVQAGFPKGTPDEKPAELWYECKRDGIVRADQLDEVVRHNDRMIAFGKTPGFYAEVSLNTPAPPLEQTLQQSQALDEKRVQQMEQFREQQAQINAQSEGAPRLVR